MHRLRLYVSVLIALLLPGAACRSESGRDGKQSASDQLHFEMRVPPGADQDTPLPLVVAVHGLAGDEHYFQRAFSRWHPRARLVFPRAPDRWRRGGYSWFDLALMEDRPRIDHEDVRRSARLLVDMIEDIRAEHATRDTIVVGFSQGGLLAYALAVHHPGALDLAVAVSAYLPSPLVPDRPDGHEHPPVHAFHGKKDRTIRLGLARGTARALEELGTKVALSVYPEAGHLISGRMLRDVLGLLRRETASPGSSRR